MIKIPSVLRKKLSGTKAAVFILDNPNSIKPNSSGKGEAIIMAPRSGIIKRTAFRFQNLPPSHSRCFSFLSERMIYSKSALTLFFTNRKIIRSPHKASSPPRAAVIIAEFSCAISPNTAVAGIVVKIDVKKARR